jgi:hypothetical protein
MDDEGVALRMYWASRTRTLHAISVLGDILLEVPPVGEATQFAFF